MTGWRIILARINRRRVALPLLLAAQIFSVATASAQGIPVVDMSAVAEAEKSIKALQDQLQQMASLVKSSQAMLQSIGNAGPISMAMQKALGAQITFSANGQQPSQAAAATLSPVLANLAKTRGIGGAPVADFTNYATTRNWVDQVLSAPSGANATERTAARQARIAVAGEAAANGYALALNARQMMASESDRLKQLNDMVTNAGSLREDVIANTAIILAMHDEMAQLQGLLAALLTAQSADQLVALDDTGQTALASKANGQPVSAQGSPATSEKTDH